MAPLWIVVPARGIATGKSRLAAVLEPAARAGLNRLLLSITLRAVAGWRGGLERCVVVSPCAETLDAARGAGAAALPESPSSAGHNGAVSLGAAYARARGAGVILILAADLPYAAPAALDEMANLSCPRGRTVVAPDRAGDGTNALLIDAGAHFEFHFGERSCARHLDEAAALDMPAVLCRRPELQFDLDTPDDLAEWRRGGERAA